MIIYIRSVLLNVENGIKQLLKLPKTNLEVIKKYFERVELHAYKQTNKQSISLENNLKV